VRQDRRGPFVEALEQAREAAYPPGEFVGQESFMRASQIRRLADRARIGPGAAVLDVCCGVAGPGRLLAAERRCRYLGVDYSPSALRIARDLAGRLSCRFAQAHVPPLPDERVDVVLLLETMLAFPDKAALVSEVARVLEDGGRFACTLEEGRPLTAGERDAMPDADTVWLVELADLTSLLRSAGLTVTWHEDLTAAHAVTAKALLRCFRAQSEEISAVLGERAVGELVAAHELWVEWLGGGRVRKVALVAEKR
jgi:SAM-dependent methyltransferase